MTTIKPITPRRRESIVWSLKDQQLDVRIGGITLAEYHRRVDKTVELFAAQGVDPLPEYITKWNR